MRAIGFSLLSSLVLVTGFTTPAEAGLFRCFQSRRVVCTPVYYSTCAPMPIATAEAAPPRSDMEKVEVPITVTKRLPNGSLVKETQMRSIEIPASTSPAVRTTLIDLQTRLLQAELENAAQQADLVRKGEKDKEQDGEIEKLKPAPPAQPQPAEPEQPNPN